MRIQVTRVVTPCNLERGFWRFGET